MSATVAPAVTRDRDAISDGATVARRVLMSKRMKTSLSFALLMLFAACHDGSPGDPDGSLQRQPDGSSGCPAPDYFVHVSCVGGQAMSSWQISGLQQHQCLETGGTQATCAQGCAVESDMTHPADDAFGSALPHYAYDPSLLCKDTPAAKIGDACTTAGAPCEPTRAQLGADGTVASNTGLVCSASHTCEAGQPTKVDKYLTACDPAIVAQYGESGAVGVTVADKGNACLIAWDATASAAKSGVTITCAADSDCPDHALCDDAMAVLSPTTAKATAVCKPGPRGTLTPAMLAP